MKKAIKHLEALGIAPGLWKLCGQMLDKVKEYLGIRSPSIEMEKVINKCWKQSL